MLCLGLALAACASQPTPPPDEPVLRETTLKRYEGSAISLEELESMRPSAIATARTLAHLERELREPWAETRKPDEILRAVSEREPSDIRLAMTLWESAEPKGRGRGRQLFHEFGFYSSQLKPMDFSPRAKPHTLELLTKRMLESHDDSTPRGKLLAAWRHFAPLVRDRGEHYLASNWRFELDYIRPVVVEQSESLLGPFERCRVVDDGGASFPGDTDSVGGYSASLLLLDLVTPGGQSPIGNAIESLAQLAEGRPVHLGFEIAQGRRDKVDDVDEEFIRAALNGLRTGACDLQALPAGALRVRVTFSYLIELAEARATLSFHKLGNEWELELFEYEPAAASLVGGNARLDLMPGIRELAHRNQGG
jgi:hypothetical protein